MTATNIPSSVGQWLASLENRPNWKGWQDVGGDIWSGVQNWSSAGDEATAIGVWGHVVQEQEWDEDTCELRVNWCVYKGDCREPVQDGFESAEAALGFAEATWPAMFARE